MEIRAFSQALACAKYWLYITSYVGLSNNSLRMPHRNEKIYMCSQNMFPPLGCMSVLLLIIQPLELLT